MSASCAERQIFDTPGIPADPDGT